MRSGASLWSVGARRDQRRGAAEQRARRLALEQVVLPIGPDPPHRASRASRSRPTNAVRNCQASLSARSSGRSHHRSPNRGRSATARRRPRGRSRSAPNSSRSCGESNGDARLPRAKLRRRAHRSAGRARSCPSRWQGRTASVSACRPAPIRSSPRGAVSAPAPTTFSASSRSIPPIRPRRRADSIWAAARLRLAGQRRAHRVDQRRRCALRPCRCPPEAGTAPPDRRWPARSAPPTWNIFGVKRSTSTPDTIIRAASASPIRSSSQARSAAQSTGLMLRGAAASASKALRSAICAQRDAIGVSIRRIRVPRNAPLAPPHGCAPSPTLGRIDRPDDTRIAPRAWSGYSIGGGGGSAARRLEARRRPVSASPALSAGDGAGGRVAGLRRLGCVAGRRGAGATRLPAPPYPAQAPAAPAPAPPPRTAAA